MGIRGFFCHSLSLLFNDKKIPLNHLLNNSYSNNPTLLFIILLHYGNKPKNGKIRFQDFRPGHYFGHLFLSFFENLGRLSCTFFQYLEIVGRGIRFSLWTFMSFKLPKYFTVIKNYHFIFILQLSS